MTHDWDRTEGWFHRLVSLDAAGRQAALEELSAEDVGLAEEVRGLLHAHDAEGVVDQMEKTLVRPSWWSRDRDDLTGRRIGPYEVGALVARGGMGDVYQGRDTRLGREVAIKVLPPWSVRDPKAEERFLAEARAISTLDHTNICVLLEADRTGDGRLFLVTPFYPGETLQARLERGPLPPGEATGIALQVAQGLSAAHERGVVHRDIKPSNLLITPEGRVKILDFGVAKLTDHTVTRPGETPGTLAYMSPEQIAGAEVDPRSDLWSLGVVLHEMLIGRRPLPGGPSNPARGVGAEEGAGPAAASLPPALATVMARLLRHAPDERYRDARELAGALEAFRQDVGGRQDGGREPATAPGAPKGRTRWLIPALAVAAVAAGLLVATRPAASPDSGSAPARAVFPEPLHRVAILPLEVFSDDPRQSHFAEGLHDVLIAELSRLQPIQVISRQSVRRFSATDHDLREIARELEVEVVGGGSVLASDDGVRISLWLSRASPERLIWSAAYDIPALHALPLQREVAGELARAMGHSALPRSADAPYQPADPAALDAFLQGVFELSRYVDDGAVDVETDRREEGIRTAIAAFEEAVRLEPGWARAHARLALAYHWLASGFPRRHADEFFPRSKAAALRALELDPDEPQALASLGFVLYQHERKWVEAERYILRSLALGGEVHWILALFLKAAGRVDEAVLSYRRALDVNPSSVTLRLQLVNMYLCAERYEEANALMEALLQHVRREGEDRVPAEFFAFLARSRAGLGRYEEAVALQERAVALSDSVPGALSDLALILARAGRLDEARGILQWWEGRPLDGVPSPAAAMVLVGDTMRALETIEDRFSGARVYFREFLCSAEYQLLQDHPRIQEIVRREGYPGVATGR